MTIKRQYRSKCQRWTLDRIDLDAEVVRVEIAPLRKEFDANGFAERLETSAEEILEWWDVEKAKTEFGSLKWIRSRLQLKGDRTLAEGMVFWVVKRGNKIMKVIHATQAARNLSKRMYSRLTREATDKEDATQ